MRRDDYLREIATGLTGSRSARRRLLAELGDHLEQIVAAEHAAGADAAEAERRAIERMGGAAAVCEAWKEQCARPQSHLRTRMTALVVTAALATVLGVAQHARGGDDTRVPARTCAGNSTAPSTAGQSRRDCAR